MKDLISSLIGDIKVSPFAEKTIDYYKVLSEIENLMVKYDLERIDISWSRAALLKTHQKSNDCS